MRVWIKRHAHWLFLAVLLLSLDFGISSLASCVGSEQQQAAQCAEKYYGFSEAVSVRIPSWLLGELRQETNLINAAATVVIAIFTVTLWLSTEKMWKASNRQLSHSKITAERQLRAYVFVTQAKILDPDGPNPRAELMTRNTGQTPAYEVTVSAAANTANVPPGRTKFDPTPVTTDSSRFVFGPDGTGKKEIPLMTLLNPHSMPGLRAGVGVLHVWGQILYVDAFRKHRWTNFRFMIGGASGWPSSDLMVICPEGNDADH